MSKGDISVSLLDADKEFTDRLAKANDATRRAVSRGRSGIEAIKETDKRLRTWIATNIDQQSSIRTEIEKELSKLEHENREYRHVSRRGKRAIRKKVRSLRFTLFYYRRRRYFRIITFSMALLIYLYWSSLAM